MPKEVGSRNSNARTMKLEITIDDLRTFIRSSESLHEAYFDPNTGKFISALEGDEEEAEEMYELPYEMYGQLFRDFIDEFVDKALEARLKNCGLSSEILKDIPVKFALEILDHHKAGAPSLFRQYLDDVAYSMLESFLDNVGNTENIRFTIPTLQELREADILDRYTNLHRNLMNKLDELSLKLPRLKEFSERDMKELAVHFEEAAGPLTKLNILRREASIIKAAMARIGVEFEVREDGAAVCFKYSIRYDPALKKQMVSLAQIIGNILVTE
ncbi:MAG: hypothetical protein QXH35_05125 [Nitrososphaerota archaeon]